MEMRYFIAVVLFVFVKADNAAVRSRCYFFFLLFIHIC